MGHAGRKLSLYKSGKNQYNQIKYRSRWSRPCRAPTGRTQAAAIGGLFLMKISRRSVLRYTGLTAAWLTLTGCAPTVYRKRFQTSGFMENL